MKTTENISLGGYAFTIETDAYDMLDAYLKEIRTVFCNDPSADEIIADIEERIAEILKEQIVSGMVVNMSMIQDIRERIGNPKELAQEDAEPAAGTEKVQPVQKERKNWKNRRMYRNMDERVFGGVCSGLGTYFGIDKVLFRILFLILFMIGFAGFDEGPYILISVLAYICLWIAMPAARTDDQKREMKGKPVNLKNYREKDFNLEKEIREVSQSPVGQTLKRAGGIFLGIILLIFGLSGLLAGIFIPTMPDVIGNHISSHILICGPLDAENQLLADLFAGTTFWGLVLVMLGIACIGMIYGGIMLLFDLRAPSWHPGLVIFIAWLISIFVIIGWVIKIVADALPGLTV